MNRDVNAIIFDLGAVIINLDFNKTIDAFNKLSDVRFESIFNHASQSDYFFHLETGKISPEEFFALLKKEINYAGHDDELIFAWNSMLLDVPEERLDALVSAKQKYNTFLLSNTNEPHIAVIERNLYLEHGVKHFEDYFDKIYYSCRVNMRKPDKEIFELVLKENELDPAKTVFIDDSMQHVQAAGACGINAYLLPQNMDVTELMKELKLI
ncbi:MAG: family hydrolase [Bacteroidetes bacterium]|jgi:putative hydrolase of the HAD superfamily|nr:family hydrolase [Bacteroidota bacterium]